MLYALRVSMPDRRGMLAEVAGVLARVGADIVTLDVVDRTDGVAVDSFCVEASAGFAETIRRSVDSVAGVVVEAIRPVGVPPDPAAGLALAAQLAGADEHALPTLLDGLPGAMWAVWSMAVKVEGSAPVVIGASAGAPARAVFEAPWLPVERATRLEPAPWMPPAWRMSAGSGALELAVAPLGGPTTGVLLARQWGARFVPSELRQFEHLTAIATARLPSRLLTGISFTTA